jgi:UDP-3-O-[3-hydroxymyristoyl] glucosamine N-acyltransferase
MVTAEKSQVSVSANDLKAELRTSTQTAVVRTIRELQTLSSDVNTAILELKNQAILLKRHENKDGSTGGFVATTAQFPKNYSLMLHQNAVILGEVNVAGNIFDCPANLHIDEGTVIGYGTEIGNLNMSSIIRLNIGKNVIIHPNTKLLGGSSLLQTTIHDNAEIGDNYKRNFRASDLTLEEVLSRKQILFDNNSSTTIGAGTTIGANAKIGTSVKIAESVSIGEGSKVSDRTEIGHGAILGERMHLIGSNTIIGADAKIGNDAELVNVKTIGDGVIIGNNAKLHEVHVRAGSAIGDNVFIEYDVSIGYRATIGSDVYICRQTKVADDMHIPSGTKIVEHKNTTPPFKKY